MEAAGGKIVSGGFDSILSANTVFETHSNNEQAPLNQKSEMSEDSEMDDLHIAARGKTRFPI